MGWSAADRVYFQGKIATEFSVGLNYLWVLLHLEGEWNYTIRVKGIWSSASNRVKAISFSGSLVTIFYVLVTSNELLWYVYATWASAEDTHVFLCPWPETRLMMSCILKIINGQNREHSISMLYVSFYKTHEWHDQPIAFIVLFLVLNRRVCADINENTRCIFA